MSDDAGWDVFIEVNGRAVLAAHYRDWHRIERLCARIEALADSGATFTPSQIENTFHVR
jgi:hypothetical protein